MNVRNLTPIVLVTLIALLAQLGCNPQTSVRDNINQQNAADSRAKWDELQPAEGVYTGKMHINDGSMDFDVQLQIKRYLDNTRAPQAENPSDTVQVPKLSGDMTFKVLKDVTSEETGVDKPDYGSYESLLVPMGSYPIVHINYGNYDPTTLSLVLPYTVPEYTQGNFGELSGTLSNGEFIGTWTAVSPGDVGTFDLILSGGTGQ